MQNDNVVVLRETPVFIIRGYTVVMWLFLGGAVSRGEGKKRFFEVVMKSKVRFRPPAGAVGSGNEPRNILTILRL